MRHTSPRNDILLPSGLERQQIFYWLKKVSSVTAWRRIFEYYRAWAAATESSLREADAQGWSRETSLPRTEYALISKCLAHCEEALIRLAKGDKRIFKFDANGELAMARRMLSHWSQMLERIEIGENGINKHAPRWPEFCHALTSLAQAWGECGTHILEPRYPGEPGRTLYGVWLQAELKIQPFPRELPPVPDPVDNIFIYTNQYTPCSGIWEPIDASRPSFISLITRAAKPQPPFKIVGAMNYLHGGSKVPRITVETANDSIDRDTTWRLLWRDDRYTDGTIPEEEAGYRFTKPEQVQPPAPAIRSLDDILMAESGSAVPKAGRWLPLSDLAAGVHLQKGEILPLHQGCEVSWILSKH